MVFVLGFFLVFSIVACFLLVCFWFVVFFFFFGGGVSFVYVSPNSVSTLWGSYGKGKEWCP